MERFRLLFLIASILPAAVSAQDAVLTENSDGLVQYQRVITVEADARLLYSRAFSWVLNEFMDEGEEIILSDPENLVIVVTGFYKTSNIVEKWQNWFNLKIESREGRARVTYDHFYFIRSTMADLKVDVKGGKKGREYAKKLSEMTDKLAKALATIDDW